MVKTSGPAAVSILKEIRTALDAAVPAKGRPAHEARSKSSVKVLGVKPTAVRTIARDLAARYKATLDYAGAVALFDAAAERKVQEEILVAIELLDRFRRDYAPSLVTHVDKWASLSDDLAVAGEMGERIAGPALALDPARMVIVRKWARTRSTGRRRLAILAVGALISGSGRDVASALEVCGLLLNEENPVLVGEVAALLRAATKVDAKAVQDFLFRRSIDGNPDILRAGSENLDAARRAALIAKLEAQAGLPAPVVATEG
jgi:3-methyladenine DNA glycosylase AlkD